LKEGQRYERFAEQLIIALHRKLYGFIFFLFLLAFPFPGEACAAVSVQKINFLQFEIGREKENLAKPMVSWAGEDLLIDQRILFSLKKKKLVQVLYNDDTLSTPCSLVFAHDGLQFAASCDEKALLLGRSDSLQLRQVKEEKGFDRLLWSGDDRVIYYTRNCALFSLPLQRGYAEKIGDGIADFYLSSDSNRLLVITVKGEDIIMNADGSCQAVLPAGSLLLDRRGSSAFIKNMSSDFRTLMIEKRGGQARGFSLCRTDWRNRLVDKKSILDDLRGGQDASFSPDMTKIALSVKDASGLSSMMILSAEGEILVKSSPRKGWFYQNPLWAPGSDWVLWNYIDMNKPEHERSRYLIADARGVALQLIPQDLGSSEFFWSPRGDQVVVRVAERGFQEGHYAVYDLNKRVLKEIFKDSKIRATSKPAWSPDGKLLAIIDYTNFQKREKRMEMAGGREREIVFFREQVFLFNPLDETLLLAW
jgi:hypothetical protein